MIPDTIRIPCTAPYLPPSIRAIPGEIHRKIRPSEAMRKIFRRGKKRRPSQWCEMYRVVTMSSIPGKWKNEVTPYLAGIMDASFFHSVREITICAAPQSGKSESVTNCIGVAIDQEPGPVIVVYPDEKTSNDNNEDRFQAMIKNSPRLRAYMTGLADDMSRNRIGLIHMPIYFGWARSASSMANKPCRYGINDEVDKYVEGKRETSAILQTKNRLTTYDGQEKHWIISSPTIESGPIWKCFNAAQVRFDYVVKCPTCGAFQKMKFGQIKWAHKTEPDADGKCHSEDPELIEAGRLSWYECPHCLAKWNDYERDLAVRHGRWHERSEKKDAEPEIGLPLFEYLLKYLPAKIAFHIPSWLSRFVSMGKTAACFLRGLKDIDEFKNFCNKHKAEPWIRTIVSKDKEQVFAARCGLPPQTVPQEAIVLTCGVDVQQFGFWFAVRAWAAGMTSWLIHYGFLPLWEDVERIIFETSYPVIGEEDRSLRIFRACVDTGGSKKFEDMTMTEETYFWLLKNRGRGGVGLWGTKGASSALPGMLGLGNGIISTPSGKKLPDMLRLLMVDTEKAKDQYHWRLQLASKEDTRGLPGAGFLHSAVGDDYVSQILAEEKQLNDKGREEWVNVHGRPNHLLDADLLAAVCVEMEFPGGGLRLLAENLRRQKEGAENPPASKKTTEIQKKKAGRW
jgi:phage terminase large subunit GpA-like protein